MLRGEHRALAREAGCSWLSLAAVLPIRYRCISCGNLTRFDVTTTSTRRAFHHYSVGGELVVEEDHVIAETVDEVLCRWCAAGGTVEEVEHQPS